MVGDVFQAIGHAYYEAIIRPGKQPEFLLLISFLVSFGFIRLSQHIIKNQSISWWPGTVSVGGTHVHHLVWGIILMIVFGYIGIVIEPVSPWQEFIAVLFGIGLGLTLDEFALWLNLEDVYWSEKGRSSIDAVIFAGIAGCLVLLGLRVFIDLADGVEEVIRGIVVAVGGVEIIVALANVIKGKYFLAVISLVVPLIGLVGALRLAKPNSLWARWFYQEKKTKRAKIRFAG